MEKIKFFALGGLDENGKSMYVVNYNEQLYIFDAGLRYPEGALLGIDVILPGFQYLSKNRDCIRGIFLTHGHDENMGALPFLIEELGELDVYGTEFTLKSLELTAKKFNKDISKAKLHTIKADDDFVVNGMTLHSFRVTHSVPDSCGYALETDNGLIVYSGDYVLDFNEESNYKTNLTRLIDLSRKPTLLLLSESYNSEYNGYVSPNNHINRRLDSIMDEVKGRLIISIYGQTISQMEEIIDCAKMNNRKVFLYTKAAKDNLDLICKHSNYKLPPNALTTNPYERDCVILVSEQGSKVFDYLNEIAIKNTTEKSLRLTADDAFVIGSPAHSGTELSFARILDILYKTDAKVFNICKDYVSMHAGSEDLKTMLTIFKPKYYFPVRGYYSKLLSNAKIALTLGYNPSNIFVFDNGMIANFVDGEFVYAKETINADEIMVDGIGIGDVGNIVINDRRKLSSDGVILASVSFSMISRKIVSGPDIQMKGLILKHSNDKFVEKVAKCFSNVVLEFVNRPGLVDFNELRQLVKEKISALVNAEIDKDPMVLPVIISV